MSEIKPGDRVGAYTHAVGNTLFFLGYGVYEGDAVPPPDTIFGGYTQAEIDAAEQEICREQGWTWQPDENPRIRLDNGDVVWGCECWWGPEEDVKTHIEKSGMDVVTVTIADFRAEGQRMLAERQEKQNEHRDVPEAAGGS